MLSVLMPAKNARQSIGLSIRTTLAALDSNSELLIYNDGSDDGTDIAISRAAGNDPRVRVVTSVESIGVANALNELLARAQGGVVARMDADDVTLPFRFTRQLLALKAGAKVVFTNRVNFGPSIRSFKPSAVTGLSSPELRYLLAFENPVPHSSMLAVKASILAAGGYVNSPAEDYELWMRLATAGVPMVRLARAGIAYRMHPSQVTRQRSWQAALAHDSELKNAHDSLLRSFGWQGPSCWAALQGQAQGAASKEALVSLSAFLVRNAPSNRTRMRARRLQYRRQL